jgi:hypothetical protein
MVRHVCIALGLALSALSAAVPQGLEVRLVLLKELSSGGSRLGDLVPFAVADDVRDRSGRVVIPEGTLALGEVVQVRREGALSAPVFDRPARLAIKLKNTWAVDDRPVGLLANLNKKPKDLYHFNRDNTQIELSKDQEEQLELAFKNPHKHEVISNLIGIVRGGGNLASMKDRLEHSALMELSRGFGISNAADLILSGRVNSMRDLVKKLQDGKTIAALLGAGTAISTITMTLRAISELARFGGKATRYVGGRFKGRNIKAPVGLEIIAFTG